MLSSFANLVKTNQFKIRSKRVVNELDTWIFKNGRIDHKDGCHDDTLTCLAMALFVIQYSMNRQIELKNKDKAMLKAMININSLANRIVNNKKETNKISANHIMVGGNNRNNTAYSANMWLFK